MIVEYLQLIFIYFVISVIVSIDVFALTVAIAKSNFRSKSQCNQWCRLNGFFHSFLLLFYLLIFTVFVELGPSLLIWISDIILILGIPFLDIVAGFFRAFSQHFQTLFGIGALVWVWIAYKEKIIEEPQMSQRGDIGKKSNMLFSPIFAIVKLFRVVDVKDRSIDAELWSVQAFIVAVDMLALAALVKSMPIVDSWVKIFVFVIIVFVVVYWLARLAAYLSGVWFSGDGLSANSVTSIKVILRMLEPLLIFYFAVELMVFIINGQNISSPVYFVASGLLVGGIIAHHGFNRIVAAANSDPRH